jgi:hypothetical protein
VSTAPYAEEPGRDYRKERDAAYTERNQLVAALAGEFLRHAGRAWLADHLDEAGVDWDPEWRNVVFIEGWPCGQMSWHIHDSDLPMFSFLPRGKNEWDRHTSEEKYRRLSKLTTRR